MRQKVFFAFVVVSLLSLVIGPVTIGQSAGGYTVFVPRVGTAPNNFGPIVSSDVHHDTSAPLAQLVAAMPKSSGGPSVNYPAKPVPSFSFNPNNPNQPDTVQQITPGIPIGVTTGLSFPGIGQGDYGYSPNVAPPDTNLAVGDTQVVQWVNSNFAVFDKATGALIYGPIDGNALWSGFGGGCQTNNDGDPIIQWDQIAHRWVFSQFSVSTLPYLQCFAVSTTNDATGAFYRYSFSFTNFPDYPKMGIWPDAYYVTYNSFIGGATFGGALDCAYNRATMVAGLATTSVCFQFANTIASILPADLDGTTLPPGGANNYQLNLNTSTTLGFFKFHVNFVTPGLSTLTSATITVAAYTPACAGGVCVVQPGTTNHLDSLANRLMYRLSYRNYGTYDALVATHSVLSTWGTSGIRWYEIRAPGTVPVVTEQSTYAPDKKFRWMGSIAQDNAGDIAMGYSVSGPTLYPSIRITGRVVGSALNTLRAEATVIGGAGSQTGTLTRWGDYSTMDVDPVDGCTFWYTNQYQKANGSFNWSTWITSFKFANCA